MADDSVLIPASTVLLLRDTPMGDAPVGDTPTAGVEVLMLRRNSKIAFGGMWVFPGGRVDEADLVMVGDTGDEIETAKVAAVRETDEETGLTISTADLATWSQWIPPALASMVTKGPRRRFNTWFFVARAPEGEVVIDDGEIKEHAWNSPLAALELRQAGQIELAPPTWVTLFQLSQFSSVDDILAHARSTTPEQFATQPIPGDPVTLCWLGDSEYQADSPNPIGRNRLVMDPAGWTYERS